MNLRRRPPRLLAEMLLQWLTLVCLAVASMATSFVILDKEPRWVILPSGSALRFNCSLNISGCERFKLTWLFNPNESSVFQAKQIPNITTQHVENGPGKSSGVSSNVSLKMTLDLPWNASSKDSGWYFCRVNEELPDLKEYATNGTRVDITKIVEHTTPQLVVTDEKATQFLPNWLLISVGASAFIVLLLICILLKTRCCKKRAEQPIYANTHNKQILSDTLKPIPFSQNLRNPRPGRRYDEGKRKHKP